MHKRRKPAALRADQDSYYRPSLAAALLALALAIFLTWQGKAHADDLGPQNRDAVQLPGAMQLPDSIHGPGADRIPPGLACTDDMDFSPQDHRRSPFAMESADRQGHERAWARATANETICPLHRARVDKA